MKNDPFQRDYSGSDAHMTESARTVYTLLELDQPAFEAFDSTFDAAFLTSFEARIIAAETVVSDTAVADQQAQITESLAARMEAARAKYAEIKYFVGKAFPDSPATRNEFGFNDYDGVRRSQPKMAQFLDELSKAATKYAAQLIAEGLTAPRIAAIQTVRTALLDMNTNQEVFIKQRPKLTEERVKKLNTCYRTMTLVNEAAGLVFAADPVKRAQYVYDPAGDTDDIAEYSGTVAPGESKAVVTLADYDADRLISLRNTGTVPIRFYLSSAAAQEAGVPVEIGGGAIISKTMAELNGNASHLVLAVKNTSGSTQGSYEVEIDMEA